MIDKEKFKGAKYQPLCRQEMLDLLAGSYQGRVAVANEGHWLHIEELHPDKKEILEQLVKDYPSDIQAFYIVKAEDFGEPGEKYVWCDVAGADPALSLGEGSSLAMDELTTIDWETIEKISEGLPDPNSVDILANVEEADGRYRLFLLSGFLFTRMWSYRGIANSLTDIYTDSERVKKLLRRITDYFLECVKTVCEQIDVDGLAFCDDWGMQKGPFMSPEKFREFYFPFYQEVFDLVHAYGKQVWLHCCGDVMALTEQFIEAGVDVLHPIQKFANDEKQWLANFGNRVTTWVGIDLQRILSWGKPEDVIQETRYLIDSFVEGNNNRVIMTIANRLTDDIPVENFVAFVKECYSYGLEVEKKGTGNNLSPCYTDRQKWFGQ